MGARSTGSHPTATKADGHLLEYFRQNFGVGGGANSGPVVAPYNGHTATGGSINEYSDSGTIYKSHVFVGSGTFEITELGDEATIDYLVVAGGGSGGPMHAGSYYSAAGGGGAGGLKTSIPGVMPNTGSALPVAVASYSVTVGGGGGRTVTVTVL